MASPTIHVEHSPDQTITYVRLAGTINEEFDGSQTASRISAKTSQVVLDCSGLRLITSFGIRVWGEFLEVLKKRKLHLYFVECSTAFVNELNQVVHFVSHGRVLSVNAPYTCPSCASTRAVRLRTDTDAEQIRERNPAAFSCLVCGGQMEFDEDPAFYFTGLEPHVGGAPPNDVLTFLEARLGYEGENEKKLQIRKVVAGKTTVLDFAGTLDKTLESKHLTQGLEGEVVLDTSGILHVKQQGLQVWRDFVSETCARAEKVWIVGSPTLIVERVEGTEQNLAITSVQLPFHCRSCDATEFSPLELVGKEGDQVRNGVLPKRKCSLCKNESQALVSGTLLGRIQSLPAIAPPASVPKAVRTARKEMEKARKQAHARVVKPKQNTAIWIAVAAGVLVIGGGLATLGATMLMKSTDEKVAASKVATPVEEGTTQPTQPANSRPQWIVSDSPASSYCTDVGRRISCVGISWYRASKSEGATEGFEAALEALAHFALLNSKDDDVLKQIALYTPARVKAIQALEEAQVEGNNSRDAIERVRSARKQVAKLLRNQRTPGVPAQRADWHWDEFDASEGSGSEFLVFVRVDVNQTELKAFADHYARKEKHSGVTSAPAVPGLAWLFDPGAENSAIRVVAATGADGIEAGDILVGSPELITSGEKLKAAMAKPSAESRVAVHRGGDLAKVKVYE